MSIELPALPYARDALEPYISKETLDYHYGRHHQGYVTKLNKLLPGSEHEGQDLETIVKTSEGGLFNNAAQIWNHSFYWNCLSANAGSKPEHALAEAIDQSFNSFTEFKQQFTDTALSTFGSGWAWLVKQPDGRLAVTSTGNADSPLQSENLPLLTCDVWEHAYYIDYRNARAQYLDAFWHLVNWGFVNQRFHG